MTAWQPSKVTKTYQHATPINRTTTLTPSNGEDCKGFVWLKCTINAGAWTGSPGDTVVFQLQESSVVNGSGDAFANITGATVTVTKAGQNLPYLLQVYLQPRERYIRCLATHTGTAGSLYGITFELFHAEDSTIAADTYVSVNT